MTLIAEFAVSTSAFLLSETLADGPDVTVEIERVVADGTEQVTPYFWVQTDDFDAFDRALREDPTVEGIVTMENHDDDERFYRVTWTTNKRGVTYAISDAMATILDAVGSGDGWELRMLFPDEESLSAFHDYCATYDIPFDLERVYHSANPQEFGEYEVTEEQQEALVTALEAGYFEIPREVTMGELADRLGISSNAVSSRLRRGHGNLIRHTLAQRTDEG